MVVQAKGLEAPSRADRRAIVKDVCIDRWIEALFQYEDNKAVVRKLCACRSKQLRRRVNTRRV